MLACVGSHRIPAAASGRHHLQLEGKRQAPKVVLNFGEVNRVWAKKHGRSRTHLLRNPSSSAGSSFEGRVSHCERLPRDIQRPARARHCYFFWTANHFFFSFRNFRFSATEAGISKEDALSVMKTLQSGSTNGFISPFIHCLKVSLFSPAVHSSGGVSVLEMLQKGPQKKHVFTFSDEIDSILGGGIAVGDLTEICTCFFQESAIVILCHTRRCTWRGKDSDIDSGMR